MRESKAVIIGVAGTMPTADELALYREHLPWGFILFARSLKEENQIKDLIAALRDSVSNPDAPVFIDQEGGRVQRLRPPLAPEYPSAQVIGDIYRRDRKAGLEAARLMSRLHAVDLKKYGFTADCLPVLDVPVEGASNVIGNRAYGNDPKTVTELGRAAAEVRQRLELVEGPGLRVAHRDIGALRDREVEAEVASDLDPAGA